MTGYAGGMNDLDRSILATLAYYGAVGWSLTLIEVHERLIPASRLGGVNHAHSLGEVMERLEVLEKIGALTQENGLYLVAPADAGFAARRIEQEKIWAQKWRRMLRKARWLQVVPYVRGIYASGSLAFGNMSEGSDWDIFLVVQAGRLYTARFYLLCTAWLLRALRTKHDTDAADKFCFNHYVTTTGLSIRHRSLYVAHGLALLVPVYDSQGYLPRLWQANQWISDFRSQPESAEHVRRTVHPLWMLTFVRRIKELVLNTIVGDCLERVLRAWQQRRIRHEPATHARGGRIVADDRELEFHPRSFEAVALGRYNGVLERLSMGAWRERDSGLTK